MSTMTSMSSERWRCFQTQLLQCWLGEALAHVAECAAAAAERIDSTAFIALREDDDAAFAGISTFAHHFHTLAHVQRQRNKHEHNTTRSASLASPQLLRTSDGKRISDVDAFRTWLRSYRTLVAQRNEHACLVVLFAPQTPASTLASVVAATRQSSVTHSVHTLLLVITDPMALMDVDASLNASSSSAVASHPGFALYDSLDAEDTVAASQSTHALLVRPLEQLASQCGLRFVMEIARWTLFHDCASDERPQLPLMLTSVSHMPFQLLLQLLRWSHFHPIVAQALAKPFERKLRLIPQRRVRDAIAQLQADEQAVWCHLDGVVSELDASLQQLRLPSHHIYDSLAEAEPAAMEIPTRADARTSSQERSVSECELWDVQKQFYVGQGIRAWSDGLIPFGVSSSSFLAAAYARVAVEFFLEATVGVSVALSSDLPNCFVWEAASGSCKFLHAFLLYFFDLVDRTDAFAQRGLRPCVVASDLSDQVLASRMAMPCFAPFLQTNRLEFARFDTAAFAHGDDAQTLRLQFSDTVWRVGSNGPVFVMGNYFVDSLRTDVFAVTRSAASSDSVSGDGDDVAHGQSPESDRARLSVYRGRVDHRLTSIADMELSFERIDPFATPAYDDAFVNNVLLDVLTRIASASPKASASSSLVLFPVEAIAFVRALVAAATATAATRFPVGVLIGDASFSFRDPISSAFFASESDSFELPQLSPHPDCFCLPVDFAILEVVLERLGRQEGVLRTEAQVATALATDTFDVLYGTIMPQAQVDKDVASTRDASPSRSHTVFRHAFASFTPSDCDLLWGMMGVDDGAAHFSLKTHVALLAQSAYDADLFAILQWSLLRRWRQVVSTQNGSSAPDALRLRLIRIATRCWRTQFSLETHDAAHTLVVLQHARWLYGTASSLKHD